MADSNQQEKFYNIRTKCGTDFVFVRVPKEKLNWDDFCKIGKLCSSIFDDSMTNKQFIY